MGVGRLTVARRAVFLDRDGTLNRAYVSEGIPRPPRSLEELELLPGVVQAVARLRAAGFVLVMITNQPDVARGSVSRSLVNAMNAQVALTLGIDKVETCFHDDDDRCDCRKPRPGMLVRAAQELGLNVSESFMVGDRWRDTEAGRRAGCRTIQLRTTEVQPSSAAEPDYWVADLAEASSIILRPTAAQWLSGEAGEYSAQQGAPLEGSNCETLRR